jgi:uncharacterized protein involved in exopolysaccharide biosynthesis
MTSSNHTEDAKGAAEPIYTRELTTVLLRWRWLIVAATLFFTVLMAVIAFTSTRIYQGSAVVIGASNADLGLLGGGQDSSSLGGLAALAGLNLGPRDSILEEALAVLRSRQFTEAFIAKNNLMPVLFSDLWDAKAGKWNVSPDKQPTLNRAFRVFDALRSIKRDTKTGLITLQIDWRDRFPAVDWTNRMIEELNQEMRQRAIKKADLSIDFLQKELPTTSDIGTREAINRLMASEIKERMLADVTEEYALRFVDRATVPDPTEPVAPKKSLLIGAGMIFGIIFGMCAAVFFNMLSLSKAQRR